MKNAIILAAGEGRRMGGQATSKCLLPLYEETTFLSRHIELLRSNGISNIFIVVTKDLSDSFMSYKEPGIRVIISPFSGMGVGSSLSLLCGLEAVLESDSQAEVLVMDGDIAYENTLMNAVAGYSAGESCLFVIDRIAGDDEEVRVYSDAANRPVLIGKGFPPQVSGELNLLGESIGIIYIDLGSTGYCRDLIYWIAGFPPQVKGFGYSGVKSEHEEVWQYLFNLGRLNVRQLSGNLLFAECDTPNDYKHIRENIFPAIRERDGGRDRPVDDP
jgi:choline kinase